MGDGTFGDERPCGQCCCFQERSPSIVVGRETLTYVPKPDIEPSSQFSGTFSIGWRQLLLFTQERATCPASCPAKPVHPHCPRGSRPAACRRAGAGRRIDACSAVGRGRGIRPVRVVLDASGAMMQDDAPGLRIEAAKVSREEPHRRHPARRPDGTDGLRDGHRLRTVLQVRRMLRHPDPGAGGCSGQGGAHSRRRRDQSHRLYPGGYFLAPSLEDGSTADAGTDLEFGVAIDVSGDVTDGPQLPRQPPRRRRRSPPIRRRQLPTPAPRRQYRRRKAPARWAGDWASPGSRQWPPDSSRSSGAGHRGRPRADGCGAVRPPRISAVKSLRPGA